VLVELSVEERASVMGELPDKKPRLQGSCASASECRTIWRR
jgi:hypothetical protein